MPISIAEMLIDRLTKTGAQILDPMVGSGTTLIAAKKTSRNGEGVDRDFLALRIARCATCSYDAVKLNSLREVTLRRAKQIVGRKSFRLPKIRSKLSKEDQSFIKYWFSPHSQKQLFALAAAIEEIEDLPCQDFAWIVFSSLIIAKSAGASLAIDISRSRPHKVDDKPVILPFDAWDRRYRSAVLRAPFVNEQGDSCIRLSHGDARNLPVPDSTIDFVLTSPPYRNAVDYLRSHKFSLVWMGQSIPEIRELRGTMIGSERGLFSLDGIPDSLETRVTRSIDARRDQALTRRYLSDIRKALGEMFRVLKPGGLAILVVGPTMINSRKTDAADVLSQIGEHVGLRLVASAVREINAERRSLPAPGTIESSNFLASRMRREVIVALRK